MSKKIKLDISDIQYDFYLVGIVSTTPIFKLAWLLNDKLHFQFSDAKSIKDDNQIEFLQFQYSDKETGTSYSLIENKNANGILIKEHKNIDFILKIIGHNDYVDKICLNLRQLKNITAVLTIN